MRREVLVAIFIGILLGAAVAFGAWRARTYLSPQKTASQTEQAVNQSPQENVSEANSQLILTQPEDNSVATKDIVTVKGSTTPNATVVIAYASGENIIDAKADGSFEQDIELNGGPNQIDVTAYDKDGNESKQSVMVVYSTEFGGN